MRQSKTLMVVGIMLMIIPALVSCSPKVRYVTQTVEIPKIVKEHTGKVDSVIIKNTDSVYVNKFSKADTVYVETTKVKYRDRNIVKIDTVNRIDSISIPVRYDNPQLLEEIGSLRQKIDEGNIREKTYKHTISMYNYAILIGAICLIVFNFGRVKKLIKWLIKLLT